MRPKPIHMLPLLLLPAACIHAAPKQSQTHPAAALAAAACKRIHLMQPLLLLLHANMLSNLHTASMLPLHLLLHTEHLFLRDLRLSSHMLLLQSSSWLRQVDDVQVAMVTKLLLVSELEPTAAGATCAEMATGKW